MESTQSPVVIHLIIKGNREAAEHTVNSRLMGDIMAWFAEKNDAPFCVGDLLYHRVEYPQITEVQIAAWQSSINRWVRGDRTDCFDDRLIAAMFKADDSNRDKICKGFPGLSQAYDRYMKAGARS